MIGGESRPSSEGAVTRRLDAEPEDPTSPYRTQAVVISLGRSPASEMKQQVTDTEGNGRPQAHRSPPGRPSPITFHPPPTPHHPMLPTSSGECARHARVG